MAGEHALRSGGGLPLCRASAKPGAVLTHLGSVSTTAGLA